MLLKRDIYNLSTVPIYPALNQLLGKSTRFVLIKKPQVAMCCLPPCSKHSKLSSPDSTLSLTLQQALQTFFVTEIFGQFGIYTPTHRLRTMLPFPEDNLLLPDVQVLHKH